MKKGFTLAEIICTLGVMSILMLIVSPSLVGYVRKDRLRTTTDLLVSDLRYSKMHAVSNAERVHVRFNKAPLSEEYDSYLIYSYVGTAQYTIKEVNLPLGVRICSGVEGTTLDSSGRLTFATLGNVSPFPCTIVIKDLDTLKKEYITLTIGYTRIMRVIR